MNKAQLKTKVLVVVFGFVFIALATPARAEVIKLLCNKNFQMNAFSIDVDMDKSTVFWVWQAGSHPDQHVQAEISENFITWHATYNDSNYQGELWERLDRQTGTLYWWGNGKWLSGGACERAGKPVL